LTNWYWKKKAAGRALLRLLPNRAILISQKKHRSVAFKVATDYAYRSLDNGVKDHDGQVGLKERMATVAAWMSPYYRGRKNWREDSKADPVCSIRLSPSCHPQTLNFIAHRKKQNRSYRALSAI